MQLYKGSNWQINLLNTLHLEHPKRHCCKALYYSSVFVDAFRYLVGSVRNAVQVSSHLQL